MNFFKKIKLRAMLRNCDYILAGTVIKQQYYDENKDSQINRKIDQFMANPGFDEAAKLIKHNEMMVYYFTESCHGGLYVRKQETNKQHMSQDTIDLSLNQIDEAIREAAGTIETQRLQPKSPFINEDSWMNEETLRSKSSSQPDFPSPEREGEPTYTEDVVEETSQTQADSLHIEPTLTEELHQTKEIVQAEEALLQAELTLPEEPLHSEDTTLSEAISHTEESPLPAEAEAAPTEEPTEETFQSPGISQEEQSLLLGKSLRPEEPLPEVTEAPISQPTAPKRDRHTFPNVIKTLSLDLNTMVKQADEYRRQISYGSSNEAQLKSWVKSLEKGIHEFALAIDVLEGDD